MIWIALKFGYDYQKLLPVIAICISEEDAAFHTLGEDNKDVFPHRNMRGYIGVNLNEKINGITIKDLRVVDREKFDRIINMIGGG
jgi:hypothetical protein